MARKNSTDDKPTDYTGDSTPTLPPGDATVTRAEPTIDTKLIEIRNAEAALNAGRVARRK